ncbi:MAG TPA: hypothetical protein VHG72_03330 [Polyangia bacterium]|nr:hypothetical protein [Polyangia bacterium]
MRRAAAKRAGLLVCSAIGLLAPGRPARAAQLIVDAPAACVDPAALSDEVSDLIGKPLAAVPDVDFRVEIGRASGARWRLHLEMLGRSGAAAEARGTRTIEGATCAELAEAAAVAISVSVRSIAAEVAPSPSPTQPPVAPAAVVAVSAPPHPVPTPPPSTPWRPGIALALATGSGVLPSAGLGLELEGRLQRRSLWLVVLGAWYASQDASADSGTGGRFGLVEGGALACFAPRRGRWTASACGGFELGRLAGTGTGLGVARPQTGAAFWQAARAELGLDAAVSGDTSVFLRAGAALARTRPEFVLDGTTPVYRPDRIGARLTAGFALSF